MNKKAKILFAIAAVFGGLFAFSHSAHAADISISNSGKVSFGKVQPSSVGTLATATDTLSVSTDCSAGANVYVTSTNGGSTSMVNNAANSNNAIATSSATIGSAATLSNNTWGLNTNATEAGNGLYYGLPAYSGSSLPTPIYSGTNSSVLIYYGAKVTSSLTPGTYTGQVLYTATVHSSCLTYTVVFNKNSNDATGTMSNQSITPAVSTPLTANGFTKTGYTFLGWSTSANGKTGTAANGVGTSADVDYIDGQSVTDLTSAGGSINLYAIWALTMQSIDVTTLPVSSTTTLADARDSQTYTVYRWPLTGTAGTNYPTGMAGFAIMTQDLSLGYVTGGSVTQGSDLTLTADNSAAAGTITARTGTSDWSTTNPDDNLQYINGAGGTYDSHSYYSYGAAQKVCPKGWRPPTNTEYSNIATFMGGNNATGSSTIRGTPYNFVYGGSFLLSGWGDVGSYGYYWSSTQYNSSYGYRLSFNSSTLRTSNFNKTDGMSVRCVAEAPNHTVTISSGTGIASTTGSGTHSVGETVNISATPSSGYNFSSWTVNSGGASLASTTSSSTSFTMPDADVTITANGVSATPTCSASVHPTTSTGCKMADNKTWILGNNGGAAAWTALFTNATSASGHDATLVSGKCPSDYSAPKKSDYDTLVASYSGGGLYTALGLSGGRTFWSSTERGSGYAYRLGVSSSDAFTGYTSNSYSYYLLCVK